MKSTILLIAAVVFSFCSYAQTWQWTHPELNNAPGSGLDYSYKVVNDANGNVYQLGRYGNELYLDGVLRATGSGGFVAKYNPSGKLIWYKLMTKLSTNDEARIDPGDLVISNNKLFLTGNYKTVITNADPCQASSYYTYKIGDYSLVSYPGDIGMFFSCLDLNGNMLWTKTGSAYRTSPYCYSAVSVYYPPLLTTDKNNNVIVTFSCSTYDGQGFTLGGDFISVGFYSNPYGCHNLIIAKYNNDGTSIWTNYAAEEPLPGYVYANPIRTKSIVCDNNGNVFIDGRLNDNTHFNTILFRTTSSDPYSQRTHNAHMASAVLIKITADGVWSFVKEIASATSELDISRSQNLAIDGANNLYVATKVVVNCPDCGPGVILGDTLPADQSKPTMYLVKLRNNGSLVWKKVFGSGYDEAPSGFVIANNKLYVSGTVRNYGASSYLFSNLFVPPGPCGSNYREAFIAQADTSGNFKWTTTVCGNSIVFGKSLCVYKGNVYVAGEYGSTITNLGNLNSKVPAVIGTIFLGKISDRYIKVGAIAPVQVCIGSTVKIPFTAQGLTFTDTNTFTAEMSDATGKFNSPVAIGSVVAKGTGTINGIIPNTVQFGQSYRIRIKSSDTLKTGFPNYAYADVPYAITVACPAPSAGFATTNITAKTATLNWSTVPCADFYYAQYRKKGTTAWTTVNNASNTGSIAISGLSANSVYQWKVATKCTNNGSAVVSAYSKVQQFTTAAALIAMNSSRISNESNTSLYINPNPATSIATVVYNATRSGTYTLQIIDVAGKVLLSRQANALKGNNTIPVNVSQYSRGVYMVTIISGSGLQSTRLIVE